MKPTDTSAPPPEVHLLGMMHDQSAYIRDQEAAGQAELVASDVLPIDARPDLAAYEAIGFQFGEQVDSLFRVAQLPLGWRKEPTDHAMWSRIVDRDGVERVSVFPNDTSKVRPMVLDSKCANFFQSTSSRAMMDSMRHPDTSTNAGESGAVGRLAYSPGEAAEKVGVSRQHIHALIKNGTLRSVLIGRCRRIPASEIDRLLGDAA